VDVFVHLTAGLAQALQPVNFLMILIGLTIGIVAGALPGISMVNAIVLALPFTYLMEITPSLLLMAGIYCGGCYAGTITGILFNIPGDPMNVPQTWEGYQLNRKGEAALALGTAITTSALGGFVSALIMTFASPPLAKVALLLSPVEYFAVVVLGLTSVVVIGQSSMAAAFVSLFSGMFLATVGVDPLYGSFRFTFGTKLLQTGIDFVPVMIGLFAIGEVLERVGLWREEKGPRSVRIRTRLPRWRDLWPLRGSIARGIGIGTATGAVPGAGAAIAAFVSYGVERQISKRPERFGTGVLEGLAAPETAANASTGGAMIPLLTLGIPGSAAAAVMLAAFTLHGVEPGPLLFVKQPGLVYTIFAGFLLTNLVMVFMGLGAAKAFVQLLRIPEPILAGFIVLFCFLGAYAIRNDLADAWIAMGFGVVGYFMRRYQLPIPPLILGLILGPLAEEFFRTAMGMHGNDWSVFFTRPISAVFLLASLACLLWPAGQVWLNVRRATSIRRALPVLDLLVRLEGSAQRLYASFAERFQDRPTLAESWQRLSEDEGRHLGTLSLCRDMITKTPPFQSRLLHLRGGAVPDGLELQGVEISRLLQRVEQGIRESRSGTVGLDDAFEIALALETSEIHEIYALCLTLAPRPFSEVLSNLSAASDRNHLGGVASMIRAFSSNQRLHEEAAKLKAQQAERSVSSGSGDIAVHSSP
jgi:putative tricarboxylic transport membrane protein